MTKYQIEYSYQVPEWGTIELNADNKDEAEGLAYIEIKQLFPEVLDVQVDSVKVIN